MTKKAQKKIELNLSILMDDDRIAIVIPNKKIIEFAEGMLFSPTELKEIAEIADKFIELATEVSHGR